MTAPVGTELTFFPVGGYFNAVVNPSLSASNSDALIQPVSGLAMFHPRQEKGRTFQVPDYLVSREYNTLQQVFFIGNPDAGVFALSLLGKLTPDLPVNVLAAELEAALEGLSSIGVGNVAVSDGVDGQSFD